MFRILEVTLDGQGKAAKVVESVDEALVAEPPDDKLRWIDLGHQDERALLLLQERFNFHPLAIEDCRHFDQRPKIEEYSPYLTIGFASMVKKRAGWLAALFLGEMLTATAMANYEEQMKRAVVLALFVPLIISSGGNSGSQASTLVIRAMALGELKLSDWWRVIRREVGAGAMLGLVLGSIGFVRIIAWQAITPTYGPHYMMVAGTVFFSLIGVVLFGTMSGSILPLVLRRLGFDPASASAPFVATLVDVTGLIIYFSVASIIMRGTLL